MKNVILCGGNGTRLWPISRQLMQKQFLKLFGGQSLFQKTLERNEDTAEGFLIVSNLEHYFLTIDQIEELNNSKFNIKNSTFILEPFGKNTAPAIAFACFGLDKEEIVFVTPSDHLIKDQEKYIEAVNKAKGFAKDNYLVTFGITPTHPNTGYGYIETKASIAKCKVQNVKQFKEKPRLEIAKKYLEENSELKTQNSALKYYWNSGMFMFKAGVFLEELKNYAPEIYDASNMAFNNSLNIQNLTFKIKKKDMQNIPSDSIDYAVMEKSKRVKVVSCDIGWNDLGNFDALYDESKKDENNNAILVTNNQYTNTPITIDSKNNLIISNKQVATVDIENCIIADTDDALLITKKGSSQKVKDVVAKLKTQNSPLLTTHTLVHRPWGTYEVLTNEDRYKIKRIVVKPGKRLSLQKHFHRSEHWIVVSGAAEVQVGDKTYPIKPNESTYIKMGEIHRLSNPGKIPVVLIEAQVGEYVGEDDIVRLSDDYHREC